MFFCTAVTESQKTLTLNICNEAKQTYPKKQKKLLRKDTVRVSEAVIWRWCKKGVLKNFATYLFAYYWNRHQVVDKNLSKSWYQRKQPFLQYFTLKKFYFLQIQHIFICQNSDIRENSPFFNILLWKSFIFFRLIKMCWNDFY